MAAPQGPQSGPQGQALSSGPHDPGAPSSVDLLGRALEAVQLLRAHVTGLFETIATGPKLDLALTQEEAERAFKSSFTHFMQKMVENVKELDASLSPLSAPVTPFNLGNSALTNQEVGPERLGLYSELVNCWKWLEKVQEYSTSAGPILSQNSLKRTFLTAKRRRTLANSYAAPEAVVTATIATISNTYNDMDIEIKRPLGSGSAVLNVTLGRILRAIIILKGWLMEWVVVRGTGEEMRGADGSLDLWSESRFKVFQKVTENGNAAMLHFSAPTHPELSVRSFITWLHSYITLFSQPCKKCGLFLNNNLPPTWRDLRSLEPYHEECKP